MNRRIRRLTKLPWRGRTRRGDGFGTEVSTLQKPELGARVRVVHSVDGRGQYSFDYKPEAALQLSQDLAAGARHALAAAAELAGDDPEPPVMTIPRGRR